MVIADLTNITQSLVTVPALQNLWPPKTLSKLSYLRGSRHGMSNISKTVVTNNIMKLCATSDDTTPMLSAQTQVKFPLDYDEVISQVNLATQTALKDSKQLLEIEFPTAGLDSVAGDAEGVVEMDSSMALMREFCREFLRSEQAIRTRVFFPEANEVELAKKTIFEGVLFKMDYLTRPTLLDDFGFGIKEKIANRVQATEDLLMIAYPYFSVNEMLVVEELYRDVIANTERRLIIFNGELDRIRSGYYPSFFYPKVGALAKNFLPKFETVYYIHNFKGRVGGTLYRMYPGPWQVLVRVNGRHVCVHQQQVMPSLKEVALKILPSYYI